MFLRFAELLLHLVGQAPHIANDAEAHVVLHEDLVLKRREDQPHKGSHLRGWAIPILRGEGIERQKLDS